MGGGLLKVQINVRLDPFLVAPASAARSGASLPDFSARFGGSWKNAAPPAGGDLRRYFRSAEIRASTSMGIGHDPALKAALSETDRCRQACARRASARSAFNGLMAAVGAWIDSRRECKPPARLDERLPGDVGLTRSSHRKRDRLRSALGLNAQPAIRS